MARTATIKRETGETKVSLTLDVDGTGKHEVSTGLVMFDHMLSQLARHGIFDLRVQSKASMDPDGHHTVEDVAIALGQALNEALGEKKGLVRMAHAYVPLDEALALAVVDLSGRGYAVVQAEFREQAVGDLLTDLARHFMETLAREGKFNLHTHILAGLNDHHRVECMFKAVARALGAATRLDARIAGQSPSTKGMLER
ncbi:MAG: imidazoleglycerol-phosphate dehydratase HisB [Dehalococcoidia bacterium]|nr:imidazoleglycerol-phosphate dehydratase HisB [Dehalococcoidia bacterium]